MGGHYPPQCPPTPGWNAQIDYQECMKGLRYETLLPVYHWLWKRWRERRWERFRDCLKPALADRVLDVGGCAFDWQGRGDVIGAVDLLNLLPAIAPEMLESPRMRCIQGDGRSLEFGDGEYDIVFSNSVIEHVGDWKDQQGFATELRRVSRRLWIQSPARACPVEPHYLGLFIHWFPAAWHVPLARWTSVVGLTRAADLQSIASTTRLLTKQEFRALFPDCEIWTERLLWFFPKSYVAIRRG